MRTLVRTLLDGDTRLPVAGFLNYGPDIDDPDPRKPMGPTRLGEWVWPVMVDRTPERTRIGFAYYPPKETDA